MQQPFMTAVHVNFLCHVSLLCQLFVSAFVSAVCVSLERQPFVSAFCDSLLCQPLVKAFCVSFKRQPFESALYDRHL